MVLSSIETFRARLKKLYKKPQHNYGSCKIDICGELENKDTATIVKSNTPLLVDGSRYLLKIRLPHSKLNLSKSDGFRLIAVADIELDEICLLYVYPKRGALGMGDDDIGDNYLIELLEEYASEREQNFLVKLNLEDNLSEIEDP